jgi:hypothetical protein
MKTQARLLSKACWAFLFHFASCSSTFLHTAVACWKGIQEISNIHEKPTGSSSLVEWDDVLRPVYLSFFINK